MSRSVVQPWVSDLTLMQQTVLLAAIRGADGLHAHHPSKKLLRWYRRCILVSARSGTILPRPFDLHEPQGGVFLGAVIFSWTLTDGAGDEHITYACQPDYVGGQAVRQYGSWQGAMWEVFRGYVDTLDEVPHHYQMHLMHAAEILGYKHHEFEVRDWWHRAYRALVDDLHLEPESEETLDERLGGIEGS